MAKGSSLGIQVAVAEAMDAVLHAHQTVQGREGEGSQRHDMALCAGRAARNSVQPKDSLYLSR